MMKLKYNLRRVTATPRHLVAVLKYRFLNRPLAPVRFVIFGEGRCGSTALVSRLNSLRNVHCDNEVLLFRVPYPHLQVLAGCSRSRKPIYGCKILAYHIRDIQPIADRASFLRQLHQDGFQIIHLRRENLIHHAVSNIRAGQFGYHQHVAKKRRKAGKIHVDVALLLNWMKRTEELYRYEDVLLRDLPHLSLTYEKNIATEDRQRRTILSVCDFLGIPSEEGQCAYRKISPQSLRDSLENYDEVARCLEDTPYAAYLESSREVERVC